MTIESPLGSFIKLLCNIRETALMYQGKLSRSEASTREALIDPVLEALGWDTANPNMIEFEKTLPQSRADYALYNQENKIQVIVEAKALGVPLGDDTFIFNLIMYALAAGIKDIFLTDGVIWKHYTDFTPGNISSKTINLRNDNLTECASYLVNQLDAARFWQGIPTSDRLASELLSGQILDLRSEISNLKQALALMQTPPQPIVAAPQPIPVEERSHLIELSDLPQRLTGMRPPKFIKLPDGNTKRISSWRDILLECSMFVVKNTPKLSLPILDDAGRRITLLGYNEPRDGAGHVKFTMDGREVYLYLHYDATRCVKNAIHILKFLEPGKMKSKVAVEFEDLQLAQETH